MRKIGGHVGTAGGLGNAIAKTLAIGGNSLQIFAGSPRVWARALYSAKDAESMRRLMSENGFSPLYIHALYLTNLASDKRELVDKSATAIKTDMRNAAILGASGVVLHIGSHQGRGFDNARSQVITEISSILDDTPQESVLLLENSAGQKGKIGTHQELQDILEAIPSDRLRVCLDTAHAFGSGYDLTTEEGVSTWVASIEQSITLAKVELIHLNDSRAPLGSGRDLHENIGQGMIGDDGMRAILQNSELSHLPLILEVPGYDKSGPDKANIDKVKELLNRD